MPGSVELCRGTPMASSTTEFCIVFDPQAGPNWHPALIGILFTGVTLYSHELSWLQGAGKGITFSSHIPTEVLLHFSHPTIPQLKSLQVRMKLLQTFKLTLTIFSGLGSNWTCFSAGREGAAPGRGAGMFGRKCCCQLRMSDQYLFGQAFISVLFSF